MADAAPVHDVEHGATAPAPAKAAGGKSKMVWVPVVLRVLEIIFCMICFSILFSTDGDMTKIDAGQFLIAASLIGFILAVLLLVVNVAQVFVRNLDNHAKHLVLGQILETFVVYLLLFGASCAFATVATQSCKAVADVNNAVNDFMGQFGLPAPSKSTGGGSNDCDMMKAAAAMGFLGSFVFMAHFWFNLRLLSKLG
eukprot:TRINITY_DN1072_c0_g3_i1.p2 TRINITY_DN1072_c0_g3~~TRINITY_DN1072_c0_g3_i1.p2  ORF type:complete len:197 (+),score=14.54 TRINITY_DN1072_c0_g3_i1:246-836(+)